MNAITNLPFLAQPCKLVQPCITSFMNSCPLVQRIVDFSIGHFLLIENTFVCGLGIKELVVDRVKYERSKEMQNLTNSLCLAIEEFELAANMTADVSPTEHREHYEVHGGLFSASGAIGILNALYAKTMLAVISQGLFTFANVIAFKYHIVLFRAASDPQTRKSAAIGLLSNVGYIMSTALVLVGASATMVMLLGCFAVTTGGIKIVYDAIRSPNRDRNRIKTG